MATATATRGRARTAAEPAGRAAGAAPAGSIVGPARRRDRPRRLGGREVPRRRRRGGRPARCPAQPGPLEPAVPLAVRERPEPAPRLEHPARASPSRGSAAPTRTLAQFLVDAALYTWREAAIGFVLGALLGLALATVFVHSRLLERALVPYVVASQTIPIIALAPMIVFAFGANVVVGRRHRDLPDVLPGDDRDDPRPALVRPAGARADALVRRVALRRSTGSCACRPRCRTCSRP